MKQLALLVCLISGFAIAFAASERDVRQSVEVLGLPEPEAIAMPQTSAGECKVGLEVRGTSIAGDKVWMRLRCRGERQSIYAALIYRVRERLERARTIIRGRTAGTPAVVIAAGSTVQMIIRSKGVTLHEPVKALQGGRMGQKIRVRDEFRRIFLASVRGVSLVEAEL